MTNRLFGHANYSPGDLKALVEAGGDRAEKAYSIMKSGTAPLNRVIVSPVRIDKGRSFRHQANALEQLCKFLPPTHATCVVGG